MKYIVNTILLIVLVSIVSVTLGVGTAWLTSVFKFPGSRWLPFALVIPLAILGPSGSGKTTLLRVAAGLEILQTGQIHVNNCVIASEHLHTPPENRSSAIVFQDHVLFPHLTAEENVAFGWNKSEAPSPTELLANLGIQNLSNRYPDTLSGGQQQRVAIARAMATEPKVLLLDEPFSNVDLAMRRKLREDVRLFLRKSNITTLVVTHDPIEAMFLGDRIACLVEGKIVQIAAPNELWSNPEHPFVATTIANAQLINGFANKGTVKTEFGTIDGIGENFEGDVVVGILPGGLSLQPGPRQDNFEVMDIRFLSGEYNVLVGTGEQHLYTSSPIVPVVSIGDYVNLSFTPERIRVYAK